MDFLDPQKRKIHRIKLFIGYGLMAIALMFGTIVLLYQAYGYDLDPKTGEIVQNGLLFVDASPVDADVLLNNESRGRTDQRLDIAAGDYTLELRADGYRPWQRAFTLEGGTVERLTYPFLFPTEPDVKEVQLYASNPGMMSASANRERLLVQQPGSFEDFDLVDLTSATAAVTTLSLPEDLLETRGTVHTLTALEWADSDQHLLVRHNFEGGQEFVLIDVESPGASVNLSQALNGAFTDIALRDKKFDRYYVFNDPNKSLYTAELRNPTPLLYQANVLAFKPHGNDVMVLVSNANAPEGKVLLQVREGSETYTIRELSANSAYLLDVARYSNDWYYVAGAVNEQKAYVFKNPVAAAKRQTERLPVPVAVLRTATAPEFISFSVNARFITSQSGNEFAVYDAETDRQYRYDIDLGLPGGLKATWMDGHRLSVVANDKTTVFDFDGLNKQSLAAAVAAAPIFFDDDYEALYVMAPSTVVQGRPVLTRIELRVQ